MKLFGLVVMKHRTYMAERRNNGKLLVEMHNKQVAAEADRDAADKQTGRLLHKGTELALLWAAVRDCGVESQVRVVFDRLSPGRNGKS